MLKFDLRLLLQSQQTAPFEFGAHSCVYVLEMLAEVNNLYDKMMLRIIGIVCSICNQKHIWHEFTVSGN